jgi:iron complex transport system ATP-binding protein
MKGPDLTINNLSVDYGRRKVLCNLSLPPICAGRVTVLAGPNGAGKSTLLAAIAGLVPMQGEVHLGNLNLTRLSSHLRSGVVGYMPQGHGARTALSVLDAVVAAKALSSDIRLGRCRIAACETLDRLGILDLAHSPLAALSGGQRQLAALAQSLVRNPSVVLLDEPTSALDLRHQYEVMTVVQSLAAEGRIVILVLHDLLLSAKWADELIFLRDGGLYANGRPSVILTPELLREVYGIISHVYVQKNGTPYPDVVGVIKQQRL